MRLFLRLGRVLSLVLLAVLMTSVLMYCAPGYFADAREMDATHAESARADLMRLHDQQSSVLSLLGNEIKGWSRGDLRQSRQFNVAVSSLLRERALTSGKLLLLSVVAGWSLALLVAVPCSLSRGMQSDALVALTTAVLLAVPVGALATVCLLANIQGPVLVLAVMIAVRDFKVLYRGLRSTWQAPYLLFAKASGLGTSRVLVAHVLPTLRRELLSLGVMSFTLALSALVPVEVVFDRPGLGQLAWTAAMNRDLPVLVAVTALVAASVGVAGLLLGGAHASESAPCA